MRRDTNKSGDKGVNEIEGSQRRIEEIERAEAENERAEVMMRLFSAAVENTVDGIQIIGLDGRILYSNRAFEKMYGFSREELKGKHVGETIADPEHASKVIIPEIRETEQWSGELTARHRDGHQFPVWMSTSIVKNGKGEPIAMVGTLRDVTERKRAEKEAMRAGRLASLGELAAGVAHEINNPINGIINYAQILVNESEEGSREEEIAGRIIREGERIAGIVSSLLSFSRDSEEEKRPFHMYKMVSGSLALIERQIKNDGISINVKVPSSLPRIIAQQQRIEQVFLNIISNSRYAVNQKYPAGHKDKVIEITGEKISINNSLFARITFYDGGTGIPADIIDKVKNPFFSTKSGDDGTGLGLSISDSIISNYGGRLRIETVEGEYTKVIIELPAG